MNINLITTLFVYAVSLYRGLKSGGNTSYYPPAQKVGVICPLTPVSCTHANKDRRRSTFLCLFNTCNRHCQSTEGRSMAS